MMTADIAGLCAAIDGGDYTALLPLADALEEAGDRRAEVVRLFATKRGALKPRRQERPDWAGGFMWGWWPAIPNSPPRDVDGRYLNREAAVPAEVFSRLRCNILPGLLSHCRYYPSRSAAWLALAAAWSPETAYVNFV